MVDRLLAKMEINILPDLKNRNILQRNKQFKNIHKGKRCFILGNGPSLNKQNLEYLKNEFTIGTNTFWRHPIIDKWQPTYYCFAHTDLFYERKKYINGLENADNEEVENYFSNLRSKAKDSKFFIPLSGLKGNQEKKFLPEKNTFYVPLIHYPIFELPPKFPNLEIGIPWIQDISQFAIMVAMYMGFSEIILLGCDHDWFINRGEEKHFFEGAPINKSGVKFDSTKFKILQSSWFAWVLWRGHVALKEMAEKNGVEIINATGGGVLDVYPLKKYEDLVNNNE